MRASSLSAAMAIAAADPVMRGGPFVPNDGDDPSRSSTLTHRWRGVPGPAIRAPAGRRRATIGGAMRARYGAGRAA